MIDYHIHTNHSIDAQGELNEYAQRAIAIGLKEICFTNHCELNKNRNDNLIRFNGNITSISRDGLVRLQNEILVLKERYKNRLKIKFGIEVGFFDGVKESLKKITDGLELDYVLGGIHCLEHICIDSSKECEAYFQKNDAKKLLDQYFDTMEKLLCSELFDAVAHFDVYKKYGLNFYGKRIKEYDPERVYEILKLMASYGIALEINTAGLRRHNEFYPSDDFVRMAKSVGVEFITIGSDCHKPDDLATGIKQALEYVEANGFKRIFGFEKRIKSAIEIL